MLDVIGSQCFMIFVRAEILSEKSVLKFPERNVLRFNEQIIPFDKIKTYFSKNI